MGTTLLATVTRHATSLRGLDICLLRLWGSTVIAGWVPKSQCPAVHKSGSFVFFVFAQKTGYHVLAKTV